MFFSGQKGKQEKKCLDRARKEVDFQQKWGKLTGSIYMFFALVYMGLGASFVDC